VEDRELTELVQGVAEQRAHCVVGLKPAAVRGVDLNPDRRGLESDLEAHFDLVLGIGGERSEVVRDHARTSSGNSTRKAVPTPSTLSKEIWPPWLSAIVLAIDSPSPVPWIALSVAPRVRKKRSKSCFCSAAAIPIPE